MGAARDGSPDGGMASGRLSVAAGEFVASLGPGRLVALADQIGLGRSEAAAVAAVPVPGFAEAAAHVLAACRDAGTPPAEASAYLRGVAAGWARHERSISVEPVFSGPVSHRVPVRATEAVLVDVVAKARFELLLMTYSAKPYPPLLAALAAALGRGVAVSVVVETLHGAGGALSGAEPAAADVLADLVAPARQAWGSIDPDVVSLRMHLADVLFEGGDFHRAAAQRRAAGCGAAHSWLGRRRGRTRRDRGGRPVQQGRRGGRPVS